MTKSFLNEADRAYCEQSGRDVRQVERDLQTLAGARPHVEVVRPCTVGDGIRVIDSDRECALYNQARASGRLSAFIPASGAAARMFQDLLFLLEYPEPITVAELQEYAQHDSRCEAILPIFESFERLAIGQRCIAELGDVDWASDIRSAVRVMINDLKFARYPKGLLPFHWYGQSSRTAFAEHLVEAADLLTSHTGTCKVHFTVPNWAADMFARSFRAAREQLAALGEVDWELAFSIQDPATDTPALGMDQQPFRTVEGTLLFRPGGHGALLPNLTSMGGDIIVIKNIDNIVPDTHRPVVLKWRRALVEELLRVEKETHRLIIALLDGEDVVREARHFLLRTYGVRSASATAIFEVLNRPIRVCGMVPNRGEPGGARSGFNRASMRRHRLLKGHRFRPTSAIACPSQRTSIRLSWFVLCGTIVDSRLI